MATKKQLRALAKARKAAARSPKTPARLRKALSKGSRKGRK